MRAYAGIRVPVILSVVLFIVPATIYPFSAGAQTTSDPLPLLAIAQNAFEGKLTVSSATLTGQAELVTGSTNENGRIVLTTRSDGSSTLKFDASEYSRAELQDSFANGQGCSWSGGDGVAHAAPRHNCMIPVAWFLPEVALFSSQQPANASYSVTTATGNQFDLRWTLIPPAGAAVGSTSLLSHIGFFDLFIDAGTALPSQLSYVLHPDGNAGIDIPVKIVYSDYRATDGVAIPFHIQRYLNGVLALDITVTEAVVTH